jgi:hypothetical protein
MRRHLYRVTGREGKMSKRFIQIALATLLIALSGCASLKAGLNKAVLMDYDQVNNFRYYEFESGINWVNQWGVPSSEEKGIQGKSGFWATFVICSLRNEGSKAQAFPYNVSKFYVVYDGKKHHYQPLKPGAYESIPQLLPGHDVVNSIANEKFRTETQLGPDTNVFQKGYYPTVNYRFAIYVTKSSPGFIDASVPLSLEYDGYPNVLIPRNQPPVMELLPTKRSDLRTTCRPPAK